MYSKYQHFAAYVWHAMRCDGLTFIAAESKDYALFQDRVCNLLYPNWGFQYCVLNYIL